MSIRRCLSYKSKSIRKLKLRFIRFNLSFNESDVSFFAFVRYVGCEYSVGLEFGISEQISAEFENIFTYVCILHICNME